MTYGPGKYNDECTRIREAYKAAGVLVVVVGGSRGHGFSSQIVGGQSGAVMHAVITTLRAVADQIEEDLNTPTGRDT